MKKKSVKNSSQYTGKRWLYQQHNIQVSKIILGCMRFIELGNIHKLQAALKKDARGDHCF